jgi:hypothetical protein
VKTRQRSLAGAGFVAAGAVFILTASASFGQEMVYQFSFPTEAVLAQDVYINYGSGLAFDRAGNVWVADSGEGRLLQFDPSGKFLKKAGRKGQGPGKLQGPGAMRVAEDGDLFVLDDRNVKLTVLSAEGVFKRDIKLSRRYEDFCLSGGKIYLVFNFPREDRKTVDVVSLDGEPLASIGEAPEFSTVHPYNGRVAALKDIEADPEGRLIVGWRFFPIVHILDPSRPGAVPKIEIDDPRLADKDRANRGKLKDPEARMSNVVNRIRAGRDGFLALVPADRIEILDVDLTGKVRATYWAPYPEEEQYLGRDFIFRRDGASLWIYILQTMPESIVNVYKVETGSQGHS